MSSTPPWIYLYPSEREVQDQHQIRRTPDVTFRLSESFRSFSELFPTGHESGTSHSTAGGTSQSTAGGTRATTVNEQFVHMTRELNSLVAISEFRSEAFQNHIVANEVDRSALAIEQKTIASEHQKQLKKFQTEMVRLRELVMIENTRREGDINSQSEVRRQELFKNIAFMLESELGCVVCSEIFIQPSVIECGHTFCTFCINQWTKEKKDCPICRKFIISCRKHVEMDNFITKIHTLLPQEIRDKRNELLVERREAERRAEAQAQPILGLGLSQRSRQDSFFSAFPARLPVDSNSVLPTRTMTLQEWDRTAGETLNFIRQVLHQGHTGRTGTGADASGRRGVADTRRESELRYVPPQPQIQNISAGLVDAANVPLPSSTDEEVVETDLIVADSTEPLSTNHRNVIHSVRPVGNICPIIPFIPNRSVEYRYRDMHSHCGNTAVLAAHTTQGRGRQMPMRNPYNRSHENFVTTNVQSHPTVIGANCVGNTATTDRRRDLTRSLLRAERTWERLQQTQERPRQPPPAHSNGSRSTMQYDGTSLGSFYPPVTPSPTTNRVQLYLQPVRPTFQVRYPSIQQFPEPLWQTTVGGLSNTRPGRNGSNANNTTTRLRGRRNRPTPTSQSQSATQQVITIDSEEETLDLSAESLQTSFFNSPGITSEYFRSAPTPPFVRELEDAPQHDTHVPVPERLNRRRRMQETSEDDQPPIRQIHYSFV